MIKKITKLSKNIVEITIEIPWDDLKSEWDDVKQNVLDLTTLKDEFLKRTLPKKFIISLENSDIFPISKPEYKIISFNEGQDLCFIAIVINKPTVKIGDYKNIRIQKAALRKITEEEIIEVLQGIFENWKQEKVNSHLTNNSLSDNYFLQDMGASSFDALKAKIKRSLEEKELYDRELSFEQAILKEIEQLVDVELPDTLIEDEINRLVINLQRKVSQMGLVLDDYLKSQNKTLEQIKLEWLPRANSNVRTELGLAEIARLENVDISNEELNSKIQSVKDPQVKQQFKENGPRLHFKYALRQTKALDLLKKIVNSNS